MREHYLRKSYENANMESSKLVTDCVLDATWCAHLPRLGDWSRSFRGTGITKLQMPNSKVQRKILIVVLAMYEQKAFHATLNLAVIL